MGGEDDSTLRETSWTEVGVVGLRRTDLALDLFACPSSGVTGLAAEVLIRACLPRHCGEEVVTEVLPKVAAREGICEVTRKTSACIT